MAGGLGFRALGFHGLGFRVLMYEAETEVFGPVAWLSVHVQFMYRQLSVIRTALKVLGENPRD